MSSLEITHINIFPIKEAQGKLRAFVRIVLNNQLQLTGMRLYDGSNGLFLSYPIETTAKTDEYRQVFYPLSKELRAEIEKTVIEKYREVLSEVA
jgi:stage V sporulation protein G